MSGRKKCGRIKTRPMTRSENMARIRGKDTKPELAVRRAIWSAGLRYRLHDKHLPGRPDCVFHRRRAVLFVHGCFWHCHEGCRNFRVPKTRTDWWLEKFARNKARDAEVRKVLEADGWRVLIIWECETTQPEHVSALIEQLQAIPKLDDERKRYPQS